MILHRLTLNRAANSSRRRRGVRLPRPKRAEKPPRPTPRPRQRNFRAPRARNQPATAIGKTKASPRIFESPTQNLGINRHAPDPPCCGARNRCSNKIDVQTKKPRKARLFSRVVIPGRERSERTSDVQLHIGESLDSGSGPSDHPGTKIGSARHHHGRADRDPLEKIGDIGV